MWDSTLLVVTSDNGGDCDIGRWWCDGAHKDFCAQDPSPCGAHKAQDCTHEPDVPPAPKTNFDMFGPSNNYPCARNGLTRAVHVCPDCALTVPPAGCGAGSVSLGTVGLALSRLCPADSSQKRCEARART